ncbi:MAG: hypothetical protein PHO32_09415, partial [Candidatus Cloacimonetes bacterium]|nr:hypothetical protein [Candidatus Cloacimonadota bacterium]
MKTRFILAVFVLLSLFACAGPSGRVPMDVEYFSLFKSVQMEMPISKAIYRPANQTLFAMTAKTQEIQIYQNEIRKNVVGGLGTGSGNFLKLSDIGVAQDGNLMALDSAAKQLKLFTNDGKAMGNIDLQKSVQPTCFTVLENHSIFVYDQATAEIIVYSALDGVEQFRFGKFQLQQVTSLHCNRDYVVAYDASADTSHIFSVLGQLVKSETGQTVFDGYNNGINLSAGALTSQMSPAILPMRETAGIMS